VSIVALRRSDAEDKKWETDSTESHSKILKTTVVSAEWEDVQRTSRDLASDKIEVLK
jgi:phosphoribosylaminoimidazole carboxylase (NCAIR synthetase)